MTENSTRLDITGKVIYSDEITIAQAAQIITFLNSTDSGGGDGAFDDSSLDFSKKSKQSKVKVVENPRDAIDISGATKNPEKIVALGAYVLQDGGKTFTADDVKTQFRRARETQPGNFARDLGTAIAAGWIHEDDQPGEYYLTSKVDGIFDSGFTFTKASGPTRPRAGKKIGTKAKPESLAGMDEFHSTMDGYPPYSKMKYEKDRVLWVLIYMRDKHGRKGLMNKEVEWVSDHIGVGVPNGHITGAFNSAKTSGYAVRSTQDQTIKVTEDGVAYVAALGSSAEV